MGNPRRRSAISRTMAIAVAIVLMPFLISFSAPDVRAAPPTLRIVSPSDGAVIGNGSPVSVVFAATDFNLTEPGTGGPGPNEGHVQVFVDDLLFALASDPTVRLSLPSGPHNIRLRLVADNGTGLSPEVTATVGVTTTRGPASGSPGIAITYPENGAERGPDSAVSFQLSNFTLVPPGGAAGVPNEGHIEVLLDDALYQVLTDHEPVHFSDLHSGDHRVTLRLVDNAGRPLTPDVSASVQFRVLGGGGIDFSVPLAVANGILAAIVIITLYYPIQRKKA
jgi:hypothetical protein